jgi:cytochrome c peroxidase
VRHLILGGVDSLNAALVALRAVVPDGRPDSAQIARAHVAFRHARSKYKQIEGVVEFYAPALAAMLNSRRQEVDDDDAPPPSLFGSIGFPALERVLWQTNRIDSARALVDAMLPQVARLRAMIPGIIPTDAQVMAIARLELARVSTLGIAGFDAQATGDAMIESADALDGLRELYRTADDRWPTLRDECEAVRSGLTRAIAYLEAHPDFDSFDRLEFLTSYAQPATRALDRLRRAAGVVPVQLPGGLRVDAASPYDRNAFDPLRYASKQTPLASSQLIALGRRLFDDPRLSGTGTRSCASCHRPELAFSDKVTKAAAIAGRRFVARNTPTLINAALQPAQFADERAVTLEDQIVVVLSSPDEMASSIDRATRAVSVDATYRSQFAAAFGAEQADAVTPLRLRQAIAAYERQLIGLNSRFDRAVRGEATVMDSIERRGFNIFMGKAGCGTCHFAPLFSGNTPPLYVTSDVEVIGTPVAPTAARALDPDSGRFRISRRPEHLHAFKTPSLRNVTLTAPYMHNGAFRTLEQTIDFYDVGGGHVANQTLAADSLHLSAAERSAIVAFLGALVDTSGFARIGRTPWIARVRRFVSVCSDALSGVRLPDEKFAQNRWLGRPSGAALDRQCARRAR